MMLRKIIDDNFIKEWCSKHDDLYRNSEIEYENIIKIIHREVSYGTISKPTFIRILNWKASRLKGIVKLDKFDDYAEGIKQALQAPEHCKLPILDDLYGIGIPVASTILHFIYPSSFPIMDIRVTEVLYYSGYLNAKSRTQNNYDNFRRIILNIAQQTKCPLREIDKALFAYHKIELEPKIRGAMDRSNKVFMVEV
jgi:thermostable 8-oxoguanine DNA glycosylase